MYTRKALLDYIFFDIETKPRYNSFDEMPDGLKKVWLEKYHTKAFEKEVEHRKKLISLENLSGTSYCTPEYHKNIFISPITVNEIYIKEASLMPEFGEIYCISFGLFDDSFTPILNTFCEDTEKDTIESFLAVLHHYNALYLFGYNSNEFDIPFLLKRMWMNGICDNYPPQLQLKDAKPWTVKNQDHMTNYKAGAWLAVSLGLLCEAFGVPTPKDEFENYEFTTLLLSGKITKKDAVRYCEKDVKALMELVFKVSSIKSNFGSEEVNYKKTFAKKV